MISANAYTFNPIACVHSCFKEKFGIPRQPGLVADGRDRLLDAWWISTFPGLAIAATVIALSLVGDAMRDPAANGVRPQRTETADRPGNARRTGTPASRAA